MVENLRKMQELRAQIQAQLKLADTLKKLNENAGYENHKKYKQRCLTQITIILERLRELKQLGLKESSEERDNAQESRCRVAGIYLLL